MLSQMMPHAGPGIVARYYPHLIKLCPAYGINTPLEEAHFYAQIGHESGDMNYSEEIASGAAYQGRTDLGNIEPGDGIRFKGRGLIQLTGRNNYTVFGHFKGIQYDREPFNKLISTDPSLCVEVACWFWRTHGINAVADLDDLEAVTRKVNGGLNGLQDRAIRLARCKLVLKEGD